MTSAEKILAGILADAKATAEQKKAAAKETAQSIIAEAEREAAVLTAETDKEIARQTALIEKTGASGAALILRDASLSAKRELIEETLAEARESILSLPDAEYFELLCAIAESSDCRKGEIYLSAKDISRDTAVLKRYLAENGLTLSAQSADIDGGFILKNGDIEINASLDALIHEKHAELVDNINQILFNREGEA